MSKKKQERHMQRLYALNAYFGFGRVSWESSQSFRLWKEREKLLYRLVKAGVPVWHYVTVIA